MISNDFCDVYGFSPTTVQQLCDVYGVGEEERVDLERSYNGYLFRKHGQKKRIYNPWSIVNYLHSRDCGSDDKNESYWAVSGTLSDVSGAYLSSTVAKMLKGMVERFMGAEPDTYQAPLVDTTRPFTSEDFTQLLQWCREPNSQLQGLSLFNQYLFGSGYFAVDDKSLGEGKLERKAVPICIPNRELLGELTSRFLLPFYAAHQQVMPDVYIQGLEGIASAFYDILEGKEGGAKKLEKAFQDHLNAMGVREKAEKELGLSMADHEACYEQALSAALFGMSKLSHFAPQTSIVSSREDMRRVYGPESNWEDSEFWKKLKALEEDLGMAKTGKKPTPDLMLAMGSFGLVLELKIKKSTKEALEQINNKKARYTTFLEFVAGSTIEILRKVGMNIREDPHDGKKVRVEVKLEHPTHEYERVLPDPPPTLQQLKQRQVAQKQGGSCGGSA